MKIGVSSYSFWRYMETTGADYLAICRLAKEMGYEGIEFIRFSAMGNVEDEEALAKSIRGECDRIGLPVIAYTVGADFMQGDPAEVVAKLKHDIDIAEIMGAQLVRHDATRGEGLNDWRAAIRQMAPHIREVTEYAAAKGIRTCTENHGFFIQDAVRVEELILTVKHPNYGWLVDIGNFACADEDSLHAVQIAAPYAFHAHAKDFLIKSYDAEDPGNGWFRSRLKRYLRGTIVGHGQIPVRACIDTLRKAGYDGWLSVEFEGPEENLRALETALAYLKNIV